MKILAKIVGAFVGAPVVIGLVIYLWRVYMAIGAWWFGFEMNARGSYVGDAGVFGVMCVLVSVMVFCFLMIDPTEDDEDE